MPPPPAARRTAWGLALALALAATWTNLGDFHLQEEADAIVPVLASLQKWTPFYWGQDRYGLAVPLVALPLKSPLWNLLLERELVLLGGLAAMVLLARYAYRGQPGWPLVGLSGAALFLALAPVHLRFSYLGGSQPYGVSLTLGLGALLLAEPLRWRAWRSWRLPAAVALMVLGHWVNTGLVLALAPLIGLGALLRAEEGAAAPGAGRWLRARLQGAGGRELALLAVGAAAGYAFNRFSEYRATQLNPVPPGEWPEAWVELARSLSDALVPRAWPGTLLVLGAVGTVALLARGWRTAGPVLRQAAVLLGAALFYALAIGTLKWLKMNGHDSRYAQPALVLAQAGLLGPPLLALAAWLGERRARWALALALGLPLLAAAVGYGLPSVRGARGDLFRMTPVAEDVRAAGCTHVAGDYWTVWPAVYLANLLRHEAGEAGQVWGLAYRGWHTASLARAVPAERMRVAVPLGQEDEARRYLAEYGFPPMEEVERGERILVLRRVPPSPGEPPGEPEKGQAARGSDALAWRPWASPSSAMTSR